MTNKDIGDGHAKKATRQDNRNIFYQGPLLKLWDNKKTGKYEVPHTYIFLKGNLEKHVPFYESAIKANEAVYDIPKNGYKLPFI